MINGWSKEIYDIYLTINIIFNKQIKQYFTKIYFLINLFVSNCFTVYCLKL